MRILLLALCVLTFAQTPASADEWTLTDTAVETACVALFVIDWKQSLDSRFHESNVVLGAQPGAAAVDGYFLGVVAAQAVLARLLPAPWRGLFQGVMLGIEGKSVFSNWRLGAYVVW